MSRIWKLSIIGLFFIPFVFARPVLAQCDWSYTNCTNGCCSSHSCEPSGGDYYWSNPPGEWVDVVWRGTCTDCYQTAGVASCGGFGTVTLYCCPSGTPAPPSAPTLTGRMLFDANNNGLFDDGEGNIVEDTQNSDCGSYYNLAGVSIGYSGPEVGTIDYHTDCNPQPYYTKTFSTTGIYTLNFTLPTGYLLSAIGSTAAETGVCTLAGQTVTCNLSAGETYQLWFLIGSSATPPPSTCTLSINPTSTVGAPDGQTTVTYLGSVSSSAPAQNVRLWLERRDSQQVPGGAASLSSSDGSILEYVYGGKYYYQVATCPAASGGSCNEAPMITAPAAGYYFHCDVSVDPGKCSGNPFCTYEGGILDCSGWQSCSNFDNGPFDVYSPPSCSVSGPTAVIVNTPVNYCVNPSNAPLGAEIWKSPTTNQAWTNVRPKTVGNGCSSTSFTQTGTYYTVCNAFGLGGGQCSGNPWCPWSPIALPEVSCSGWVDCTANDVLVVSVTQPGSWWQVKDGDVVTNGNIISPVPGTCSLPACNPNFDIDGPGGFPGIPIYGGTTADFQAGAGTGSVSSKGWLANTLTSSNKQYNYAWFKKLIPSDVVFTEITSSPIDGATLSTGGTISYGVYWYHYNGAIGDLIITSSVSLGARKVILLVEGADLTINGPINLTKGQGFFMVLVSKNTSGNKGSIHISPSVGGGATPPHLDLEGFYEADNAFFTGSGTSQLYIRGSVVAYGGVSLDRDSTDNSATPAEVFEYAPDLIFTYPYKLRDRPIFWQEVAP